MKRTNGTGTVFWHKQRKRWVARITLSDGRVKSTSHDHKTEALKWLAHAAVERDTGSAALLGSGNLTVAAYLETWLKESVAPSVAPTSHERYERDVRLHVVPVLGEIPLRKLNRGQCQLVVNRMVERRKKPATINHAIVVMKSALNRAVEWELIPKSPAQHLKSLKASEHEMRCLSEEEAARLIEHMRSTPYEAFYLVALKTGTRKGELCSLRWSDLDLPETGRGRMSLVKNVKGNKTRSVKLSADLVATLRRHRGAQLEERMRKGSWARPELVFPDEDGNGKAPIAVLRTLHKHLEEAGLPRVRFHDLRDTAATLAIKHGTPISVIAKMLGHADPALTLRRYSHVLDDMEDATADRMDDYAF